MSVHLNPATSRVRGHSSIDSKSSVAGNCSIITSSITGVRYRRHHHQAAACVEAPACHAQTALSVNFATGNDTGLCKGSDRGAVFYQWP